MWRELLVNLLIQRTHMKLAKSMRQNALQSCINVEKNERTFREVISKNKTMKKWITNVLFAKIINMKNSKKDLNKKKIEKFELMKNLSFIIFTCESLFTFSKKIHYQISQQTNDINVFSIFSHLITRMLHTNEICDITFFTLLRNKLTINWS
jgi:hypothetical protein